MSIQLRRVADVNPPVPELRLLGGEDVTFLPLEAVWPDGRRRYEFTKPADAPGYTGLCRGDVVMPKITPTFEAGRVFVADDLPSLAGLATTEVHILRAHRVDPRYLAYFLRSLPVLREGATVLQGVGNLRRVSAEWVSSLSIPVNRRGEQRRIADYLDRETATIDTLIAKQSGLVRLLRERRRAMRSRAAMGLDLNAGTRSGEAVPAGWAVGPVKRCLESLDHKRIPLNADERGERQGEFPYYGASGIIDSVDSYLFDEDLVLVGEDGANLLNRSTPLAFVASGKYWVNNHAHVLRPRFGAAEFWAARIEAVDVSPMVSGSAQPKLTADALMTLRISWPESSSEILSIVAKMREETAKIDALIANAERFIELAQERRAALITAAVTGQIEIPGKD